MSTAVVPQANDGAAILERVITAGNLADLTPGERVRYYAEVCASVGLNPLTQPFLYLSLNGKLVLYATKGCTDQLRSVKRISIDRMERDDSDDLCVWTAYGHDAGGRMDSEVGAVPIKGLQGEAKANAVMKASTKAKRRLTLSLAGLGFLDESEVSSIPDARPQDVDMATGEIRQVPTLRARIVERKAAVTTSGAVTPAGEELLTAAVRAPTVPGPSPAHAAAEPAPPGEAAAAVIEGSAVAMCGTGSPYDGGLTSCGLEAGHERKTCKGADGSTWEVKR